MQWLIVDQQAFIRPPPLPVTSSRVHARYEPNTTPAATQAYHTRQRSSGKTSAPLDRHLCTAPRPPPQSAGAAVRSQAAQQERPPRQLTTRPDQARLAQPSPRPPLADRPAPQVLTSQMCVTVGSTSAPNAALTSSLLKARARMQPCKQVYSRCAARPADRDGDACAYCTGQAMCKLNYSRRHM